MTKFSLIALALLLSASAAFAAGKKPGITISLTSEDPRTHVGPRRDLRDARLAITTRDGSTSLLLLDDAVAVQLTDRTLANVAAKEEAGFVEELVAAGVRSAMRKAVEYPIANIRRVEVRDGALVLTNDRNQPIFTEMKVNGNEVLRGFSPADTARFVSALRPRLTAR